MATSAQVTGKNIKHKRLCRAVTEVPEIKEEKKWISDDGGGRGTNRVVADKTMIIKKRATK